MDRAGSVASAHPSLFADFDLSASISEFLWAFISTFASLPLVKRLDVNGSADFADIAL